VFVHVAVTLNERVHLKDAAFGALVAAFPNTGFMGVPLLVALLGPAAAGPVICTLLADLFVTSSLCIALAQAGGEAARAATHAPRRCARCAARCRTRCPGRSRSARCSRHGLGAARARPMGGATCWPTRAARWRCSPSAPCCGAPASTRTRRTPPVDYLPVALIKLFVHPLLVLLLGLRRKSLGAPLSGFQLLVLTLAAALPSASNVSLLAERYGADNGRVARIIMSSTVLAFVSFRSSCWTGWTGARWNRLARSGCWVTATPAPGCCRSRCAWAGRRRTVPA
jgi:malonate transporter and related proteins